MIEALIECRLSGQIDYAQWEAHCADTPGLAEAYTAHKAANGIPLTRAERGVVLLAAADAPMDVHSPFNACMLRDQCRARAAEPQRAENWFPGQRNALDEGTRMVAATAPNAGAPLSVTDAMVAAYLKANDAYWKRTDELPAANPGRWRQGTPSEATRESLTAALATGVAPLPLAPSDEQIDAIVRANLAKLSNRDMAGYREVIRDVLKLTATTPQATLPASEPDLGKMLGDHFHKKMMESTDQSVTEPFKEWLDSVHIRGRQGVGSNEAWNAGVAYALATRAKPQADAQPRLKVWLTCFPESNGKTNWTALLVREEKWDGLVGNCGGISLARGELWNRVAYEAEQARFLIGQRDTEPFILDYGDDIKTPEEWKGEAQRAKRASAAPGADEPK